MSDFSAKLLREFQKFTEERFDWEPDTPGPQELFESTSTQGAAWFRVSDEIASVLLAYNANHDWDGAEEEIDVGPLLARLKRTAEIWQEAHDQLEARLKEAGVAV